MMLPFINILWFLTTRPATTGLLTRPPPSHGLMSHDPATLTSIPPVPGAKELLAASLAAGVKRASRERTKKKKRGEPLAREQRAEEERLRAIARSLEKQLSRIHDSFPLINQLSPFYQALIAATLDQDALKKSLAAIAWARRRATSLLEEYAARMKGAGSKEGAARLRREALGRTSSIIKQVSNALATLAGARATMRYYPTLKEGLFTIAITGFPNVGKTTLLRRLTSARPAVAAYAFTTKKLNTGYFRERHEEVQVIDTPGTLARERMNPVEQQAIIAMEHAANLIIYVYDLTEPYLLEAQERLEQRIREYGKPVLPYLSKTDLLTEEAIRKFAEQHRGLLLTPIAVKEKISRALQENQRKRKSLPR